MQDLSRQMHLMCCLSNMTLSCVAKVLSTTGSCKFLSCWMIDRVADRVARARATSPSRDLCDHESLWPAERTKRQELLRLAFMGYSLVCANAEDCW